VQRLGLILMRCLAWVPRPMNSCATCCSFSSWPTCIVLTPECIWFWHSSCIR